MKISYRKYKVHLTIAFCLLLPFNILAQSGIKTTGPLTMETVLFNTDRSLYLPGEEVLLMASILEADTYGPSQLSQILRAELIASTGESILQEKLEVLSGNVSQKIKLPAGLPSGWYMIRLYTNWMRNFPVTFFSSTLIRVINPSGLENISISDNIDTVKASLVSPRGQTLISGIESRFAVRVVDLNGNPAAVSGVLVSSQNDTIAPFRTDKTGWGTIKFTPSVNSQYHFKADSGKDMTIISDIPRVTTSGVLLNIIEAAGEMNVSISLPETGVNRKVRLLVHSLYNWYYYKSVVTEGGEADFSIPTISLPNSAIIQITLLDPANNIIVTRLRTSGDVVAQGGEVIFGSQESDAEGAINARFAVDGKGTDGYYNLMVRRKEPVELAQLYIPGLPGWPVTNNIPIDASAREGWLIANSYDASVIKSFFTDTIEEPIQPNMNVMDPVPVKEQLVDFLPETRGLKISGRVTHKVTGEPVKGEILTITTVTDNFLYTATTHESGRFHFSLPGREGREDAVLSYARAPSEEWQLTLFPDFDDRKSHPVPEKISLTSAEIEYVRSLSIDNQLKAIYSKPEAVIDTIVKPVKRNNLLLGFPDLEVFVDDFVRLSNMREVIFEVVPFVSTRKTGDTWSMKVLGDRPFPKHLHSLILLDGIPMTQFSDFLNLPPERIRKIEVINSVFIHGNAMFAGAINFVSANGDLAGLSLPSVSRFISIQTPLKNKSLEVTPPTKIKSNIPDLDRILIVNPFLIYGRGTVDIHKTNIPGDYVMIISGFTSEGQWSANLGFFEVKSIFQGR